MELNLSMAFVALLLLGIAALTMHAGRLYQRGMLLKDINYVGREVTSQLQRDLAASDPSQLMQRTTMHNGAVHSGRICLGNISYLYNTAVGVSDNNRTRLIVRGDGSSGAPRIALARVSDPERRWCDTSLGPLPSHIPEANFATGGASGDTATELISRDELALVSIHQFGLTIRHDPRTAGDAPTKYAIVNLWLGTSKISAFDAAGTTCRPPADNQSDFNHCFVTEYSTIIRVGGQQ